MDGDSVDSSETPGVLRRAHWLCQGHHRGRDNTVSPVPRSSHPIILKDLPSSGRYLQGEDCGLILSLSRFPLYHFSFRISGK